MAAQEDGIVEDVNWAQDAEGALGEEVSLHLLMRVVADVGIVGLPQCREVVPSGCLDKVGCPTPCAFQSCQGPIQ